MNNAPGAGQPGQQAPTSFPNIPLFMTEDGRRIPLYRPEQMRQVPILTDDEKNKYEKGLRQLYMQVENSPQDSAQAIEGKRKIGEFSKMLFTKVQGRKQQMIRQQQQQQQQGQAGPARQPQVPQQPTQQQLLQQQAMAQQMQAKGMPANAAAAAAAAGPKPVGPGGVAAASAGGAAGSPTTANPANRGQFRVSENIMKHVNEMTYHPPPQIVEKGAAEAAKWSESMKNRYLKAMVNMEQTKMRANSYEAMIKEREAKGNPLSPEEVKQYELRKGEQMRQYQESMKFVKAFRESQELANKARAGSAAGGAGAANMPQPNAPVANSAGHNPSLQNPQAVTDTVNAAFAAAKNQQGPTGNRIPPGMANNAKPQLPPQQAAAAAAQQQAQQQKAEAPHPPPVNTAIASAVAAGQNPAAGTPTQQNRVQTPRTATPTTAGGVARPLSYQDAMTLANQTRSSQSASAPGQPGNVAANGTPASAPGSSAGSMSAAPAQVYSHAHPTAAGTATMQQAKMPIARELPESARQVPQPVSVGGGVTAGRPTYTGGGGMAGGVMGQPAVPKIPAYSHEAEGDHVLSQQKLHELVRQVCGGTVDGQEANMLSPEVEESMLTMADSFIDNVLHQACRNAKERGSKVLEIRDLQLVLERTYNIRVPGYSSDELRTVRKVQPSANWIAKMSAVQAAKVMPGKGE